MLEVLTDIIELIQLSSHCDLLCIQVVFMKKVILNQQLLSSLPLYERHSTTLSRQ